jgi:hypothetical protein
MARMFQIIENQRLQPEKSRDARQFYRSQKQALLSEDAEEKQARQTTVF